jgi:hypothetical protein
VLALLALAGWIGTWFVGDAAFLACVVVVLVMAARGARRRWDYLIAFVAGASAAALGLPPMGRSPEYLVGQVLSGGLIAAIATRVESLPTPPRAVRGFRIRKLSAWRALLWGEALTVGGAAVTFPFHLAAPGIAWGLLGVGVVLLAAERALTGRWPFAYVRP